MMEHVSVRLFALALSTCAGFAWCGAAAATPAVASRALLKAVPTEIVRVQDWRADRGRTWRDDLTANAPVARSAPPAPNPTLVPNYGTTLGYGPRGYSYSGPAYDRYITGSQPSTTTGDNVARTSSAGVASCPPRSETGAPSGASYFGSDGARHPCPD
jgi:hypothetical protein